MPAPLKPREHDQSEQVAKVQASCSGIETAIHLNGDSGGLGTVGPDIIMGEGFEEATLVKDVNYITGDWRGCGGDGRSVGGLESEALRSSCKAESVGRREGGKESEEGESGEG